jgi:hypothetical protein
MIKKNTITSEYLNRLQSCYHSIDSRGIKVDLHRLAEAKLNIDKQINHHLDIISKQWGCTAYVGADNDDGSEGAVNLNASSGKRTPLLKLQSLGYEIPKISKRNEDTGEYESKESLAELSLQKIFAANQFNILGGDLAIKSLLAIRELTTLKSRYVNANLYRRGDEAFFLSNYNCAGTTSGRRSSRKHTFGYGNNAQNFPKHGALAEIYRRCLVAREGHVLLSVDLVQAEDWVVSALANNTQSIHELQTGVDRHTKLACQIFNLNPDHYDEKGWKSSMERFLGKKTRHANNYGMRGATMSDSLAKEGVSLSAKASQGILDKVNLIDPSVKGVFHNYVEQCLYADRTLRTPFGRERQFFGMRAGDNSGNGKIFREAYSYIPQSTIGDDSGFAVFELETEYPKEERCIIQESHDSIIQEVPANADAVWKYVQRTIKAFDREIVFHNNIVLKVPTEGDLGFDFYDMQTMKSSKGSKKLEDVTYTDIQAMLYRLTEEKRRKESLDGIEEAATLQ